MDLAAGKHSSFRNILVRLLLFGVFVIGVRFAYVVTIAGESCNVTDFCFFSLPENINLVIAGAGPRNDVVKETTAVNVKSNDNLYTSKDWIKSVEFYTSVFQDLVSDGILFPESKSLCLDTAKGQDVFALKEIGVLDSVGVHKKQSKPLVVYGALRSLPFDDNTFDFVFYGGGGFGEVSRPLDVVNEIVRTLKPEGFVVVHVKVKDEYSLNSFIDLFHSCKFMKSRDIDGEGVGSDLKEIVLRKEGGEWGIIRLLGSEGGLGNECSVPGYKRELVRKAEPLIEKEPLKPWITLKKNLKNIKYLTSMVDASFKNRYVYVDVGARSYGSSIGSWFKKQYPKQNKTFEIYAIEADKAFYEEYKSRKGVKLLPYAAWVRNESLTFEINHDPRKELKDRVRGMGRIQPVRAESKSFENFDGELDTIQGFDFAEWLKDNVEERDLVVMKMDVEGTEFDLIPRLIETGAICLIDEIFLECHYNRWQRCCPGQRSPKYEKTYGQCLKLFTSLRERGVLVHQWW